MLFIPPDRSLNENGKIKAIPPMPLRGVIFDLDGTIADTLPVCFAAFREVFQDALGRDYSDQEVRAMFGPASESLHRSSLPHYSIPGLSGRSPMRYRGPGPSRAARSCGL